MAHHLPPKREETHEKDGTGKGIGIKVTPQDVNDTARIVRDHGLTCNRQEGHSQSAAAIRPPPNPESPRPLPTHPTRPERGRRRRQPGKAGQARRASAAATSRLCSAPAPRPWLLEGSARPTGRGSAPPPRSPAAARPRALQPL